MAFRTVTFAWRDKRGRIVAIGNEGEPWSPMSAGEAVSDLRARIHRYVVQGDGETSDVLAYRRGGRWYLRTTPDEQLIDNLDRLPTDPSATGAVGSFGVTGGFDVLVTIGTQAFGRMIAGMHAAEIIQNHQVLAQDGYLVEIAMDSPRVAALTPANSRTAMAEVSTRVHCWVSRSDGVLDPGFSAEASLTAEAEVGIDLLGDGFVRITTRYAPREPGAIQLLSPLTVKHATIVRAALERWMIEGRPEDRVIRLPDNLGFIRAIEARLAPGATLQIGLATGETVAPAVWPASEAGDWAVALSRWRVAEGIYAGLAEQLGGVPPPAGSQRVLIDADNSIYLELLTVTLSAGTIVLSGVLRRTAAPVLTAGFNARVQLALTSTGLVTIDDVDVDVAVREWYGPVFDFFRGGTVTRALREGIRGALTGMEGNRRVSSLLTPDLLAGLATAGLQADIRLTPTVTRVEVRPSGLVLGGDLAVEAPEGPRAVLRALGPDDEGRTLLHAGDSRAAGSSLMEARWSFGDGQQLTTSGPGLTLVVEHRYVRGTHSASVTVTDEAGDAATAVAQITL
jgi:hypothetical protein